MRTGDIVIMDNLSSHKSVRIRERIEGAGEELFFLPLYSPDLNPIEMAFSKLKALLRKGAERTVDGLWGAIARIHETFAPQECRNYVAAVRYDPCLSALRIHPLGVDCVRKMASGSILYVVCVCINRIGTI